MSQRVRASTDILGHPRGLAYLTFAESWERFSFYGMQALLVLYMGHQLLLPGHVEHVAGFGPFRAGLESVYGKLSPAALASAIFGFYAGGVYLTPLAGGWLADRVLGRTRTVTVGALLMAAGHFLMAFDFSFLIALACLLLGVGCFKGNIASQVGGLYAQHDLRRADAFQIYFLGINAAVIVAPLVCGTLGQRLGWHWGFGAAGVGMVIGLLVYLSGLSHLPRQQARVAARAAPERLQSGEGVVIFVLVLLLPILALASLGNQQIFNAYLVWGDAHYDLVFGGHTMPTTWLISLDAIIAVSTLVGSLAFWRWYGRRWREPNEITKLAIGALIAAGGPLVLAVASLPAVAHGGKVGLAWGLGFHILNDIGFSNVFPVGLALFSRAAPKAVGGLMMGLYYLHLFMANNAVGYLGGLLEKMPAAEFWAMHAALVATGGLLLLIVRALFGRQLAGKARGSAPGPR